MLRNAVVASVVALVLPAPSFADVGYVEGTVFHKGTGAPLQHAVVVLRSFDGVCTESYPGACTYPVVGRPALTDGNGFYSIEIPERRLEELIRAGVRGQMRAVAECAKGDRIESSDTGAQLIRPSPGSEIRNLYVGGLGRRAVHRCDMHPDYFPGVSFTLPPCASLPPTGPGDPAQACLPDAGAE